MPTKQNEVKAEQDEVSAAGEAEVVRAKVVGAEGRMVVAEMGRAHTTELNDAAARVTSRAKVAHREAERSRTL